MLLPGTAAADVTVAASRAEAGARDVTITFRVTNDDPAVPTTGLAGVPPDRPAAARASAGRPDRLDGAGRHRAPAAPLTVDGAPVPEIATGVAWEGGTLAGTGYAVFPVDVDRLPDGAGPLRFHVIQTFADGTTVEWSDLVPYGAPAPRTPRWWCRTATPRPPRRPGPGHHHGHDAADPRRGGHARAVVVDGRGSPPSPAWASRWSRRARRRWAAGSGGASRRCTGRRPATDRRPGRPGSEIPVSGWTRSSDQPLGSADGDQPPRTPGHSDHPRGPRCAGRRGALPQPARSSTVSVPVLRLLT